MSFVDQLELSDLEEKLRVKCSRRLRLAWGFSIMWGWATISNRESSTLSGGEAQRIQLAPNRSRVGWGNLYFDEPSIGLHQRDNDKLLETLKGLQDLGNTVLVVEHDEDTIRAADFVLDLGPGAGVHGGSSSRSVRWMMCKTSRSITGKYLTGEFKSGCPENGCKVVRKRVA